MNPGELKIDLLCRGIRIDDTCNIEEHARPTYNEHSYLPEGLEIILPGEMGEVWANAPIVRIFVENTPYVLQYSQGSYSIHDQDRDLAYAVTLAPKPDWYDRPTSRGLPMQRVGMLEGSCLVVGLHHPQRDPVQALSGRISPDHEETTILDIVETAAMARKRSATTLVLLRDGSGEHGDLTQVFPIVKALKREVGILVGVQFPAEQDVGLYDEALSLGVDHLSFQIGFCNHYLRRRCAGRLWDSDPDGVFRALEYCSRGVAKGIVSAEVEAGLVSIEDTLRAIDYFVDCRAIPLVRVYHPLRLPGMEMEEVPWPPEFETMLRVFRHVYDACRARALPIGMVPNVHLSAMAHPEDTLYLAADPADGRAYRQWLLSMKEVMTPYFLRRMRKQDG